jgi:hypothetical protein
LAKKESTTLKKTGIIVTIVAALLAVIVPSVLKAYDHFAKTEYVEKAVVKLENTDQSLSQRIEIGIIDDQIFQQEQTIQRIEDWQRYAQRKDQPVLTPIEKETLQKARARKAQLENRKEDKIKQYESGSY